MNHTIPSKTNIFLRWFLPNVFLYYQYHSCYKLEKNDRRKVSEGLIFQVLHRYVLLTFHADYITTLRTIIVFLLILVSFYWLSFIFFIVKSYMLCFAETLRSKVEWVLGTWRMVNPATILMCLSKVNNPKSYRMTFNLQQKRSFQWCQNDI